MTLTLDDGTTLTLNSSDGWNNTGSINGAYAGFDSSDGFVNIDVPTIQHPIDVGPRLVDVEWGRDGTPPAFDAVVYGYRWRGSDASPITILGWLRSSDLSREVGRFEADIRCDRDIGYFRTGFGICEVPSPLRPGDPVTMTLSESLLLMPSQLWSPILGDGTSSERSGMYEGATLTFDGAAVAFDCHRGENGDGTTLLCLASTEVSYEGCPYYVTAQTNPPTELRVLAAPTGPCDGARVYNTDGGAPL